jgi:hypothetical protein
VPLQVAVGIQGGSQISGHAIRAGMSPNPGCVTLQVDWQNAFNTLRRINLLVAKEQRCPALQPMVAWAYGQATSSSTNPAGLWSAITVPTRVQLAFWQR